MSVMDNLARDAARALAAGQTYGKWKAEHPKTKDEKIEVEDPNVRSCDVCGKPIPRGAGISSDVARSAQK